MSTSTKTGTARSAKSPTENQPATDPATESASAPWTLVVPPHQLPGFGYGLPYPAVLLRCVIPATTPEERAELAERFDALFKGAKGLARVDEFTDPATGSDQKDTITWFCALAARLQKLADLPVHAQPHVIGFGPRGTSIAIPALLRGLEPTGELLTILLKAFTASAEEHETLREQAQGTFPRLLASALTTSNTPRLVRAAVENGISFQELPGSLVQYGMGRKSVLMDSTFTHYCSNVGARLARHKQLATSVLLRAGLPVPSNAIASSEEHALQIAEKLGYPVVVKPADKDGGVAVQADLRTEEEVRAAYAAAVKVSKMVLVEKFIPGRDYRITVFRGKAIWAVERVPAGVTGDGVSTIEQLVEETNADPRRGSTVYAALKKIKLDEEAETLLARDGMTPQSIPEEGRFVRLRRASNVTSGGMPVVVTDRMHPDNAWLAERAANVIGLDLAGIDLIIPDIATSWREVDSGICEVNAQPELGGVTADHLYPLVLKTLVGGTGHIPTIAVLGGKEADDLAASLAGALAAQGICVGWHDNAGVHIGRDTILPGRLSSLRAGRILTMDRRVEAIVLGSLDAAVLSQGLPVDRIDALLVTGGLPQVSEKSPLSAEHLLTELMRLLTPHCRTVTAVEGPTGVEPAVQAVLRQSRRIKAVVPAAERQALLANVMRGVVNVVRKGRRGAGQGQAPAKPAPQQMNA